MKTVFTKFSKAVPDSFGLSFSESAGSACDHCRVLKSCYAAKMETRYKSLGAKLKEHEAIGPEAVLEKAGRQMPDLGRLRWARLAVDGSLPRRKDLGPAWAGFAARLRKLVAQATKLGAAWHIPVESMSKARLYRQALKGLGVVVRRTSQAESLAQVIKESDPRAWVVSTVELNGQPITKPKLKENIKAAQSAADEIRQAGQTAVVCPAVAGDSKCGKCTACSSAAVDVILYPLHS